MSKSELTDEQQAAVNARDSSVLVSAAAGSGKTRVIIERLMSYISDADNPTNLDSFLIITYTRAAAAELKGRITEELSRRSGLEPDNRLLRRQIALSYNADIGTIHSFCTALIRENCHKLSLSPDFRVGDEERCALLREKALENVLDTAYENMDSIVGFSDLVGSVGAGRDDSRLSETILDLYSKIQSHPYPEDWVNKQIERLYCKNISDVGECDWGAELMERGKESARYWFERLESIWQIICVNEGDNKPLIKAYCKSVEATLSQMSDLLYSFDESWDAVCKIFPIEFPRLGQLKDFQFPDTQDELKSVREDCKKAMKSLSGIFASHSSRLVSQLELTAPALTALLNITVSFGTRYSSEKRRHNILDFSDLEHFAVELLCDKESGLPSETAKIVSTRYTEIMVDEYQDVNEVQDLIFRCISKNKRNIFMVGDVKQSVYRFRLADPGIFMEKYHSFKDIAEAEEWENRRVLLRSNFRSDLSIISECNHVFSGIMSEKLGGIDYDDNAALRCSESATEPRGEVRMTVLEPPQAEDDEERPDKTALEARMIAQQIKEIIASGTSIMDKGVERPARYGDLAILLRSPKRVSKIYAGTLSNCGIPVGSENGTGFFSSEEIVVSLALLSIVDNPHRDIPLVAVMSSPVLGFSADDLSQIRLTDRNADFYTALLKRAETDEKCRSFIDTLEEIRTLSQSISVRELIAYIYEQLELPALWAKSGGKNGEENLLLLSDLALQFEKNGYRGLHSFLEHLKIMEQRGIDPQTDSKNSENCVSIMSIHKSKGLEFPIVFLADCSKKMNLQDLSRPVLAHPQLGVGGKVTDLGRGIEYPSIAHRAIRSRLLTESLSEEMRVLYVAMTRAKERLYISCTLKNPEDHIQKLSLYASSPLSPEILRKYSTFADWLILSNLSGGDNTIHLENASPNLKYEPPIIAAETAFIQLSAEDNVRLEKLRGALSFQYPFRDSQGIPSKFTATMLKNEERDDDAHELVPRRESHFRLPDFSAEARPLTAAQRGSAVHTLMQFINFSYTSTDEDIKSEIARVESLGQLTITEANSIDISIVRRFFDSDIGKRIKASENILREFRFSLLCPAGRFFDFGGEEKILLQGIVDCCIEEQKMLTIIDYKTDRVTTDTLSFTAEKYKPQLNAYAYAMERILKRPVSSCILCFLSSGLTYEL